MLNLAAEAALPRRIHEAFLPWVASHPDNIALTDDHLTLHYREMPDAVGAVAAQLSAAGVRAGDRVLLVAENSVALAVCILAVSQLDAWSATVNARLSAREIDNFILHSGARRTLYFGAGSASAQAHGQARGAELQQWPVIGQVAMGPLNIRTEPEPVFDAAQRQPAVLVYTSGTTGAPKAVMLSHANLLFIGNNNRRMRHLAPGDTVYGVLPLSHVYGLSALLVASMISGASLLLVPRFSEAALAHALAMRGVTVMHGAPAMYAKLLAWSESSGNALPAPHLRVAQSGGAPLTPALKSAFEKAFHLPLQNGYGMTEAAPSICQTRLDAPRTDCSVGQAIPGVEVRLYAAEQDAQGVGEIQVRGPNVMLGYYQASELTAETIIEDGWLRTGDLARMDADGAFHVVGRSKELIIRSGFNVYPIEVEQVLNAHPDVVQSAVVGRAVEGNEEVMAFVEIVADAQADEEALRAYARERLSPYKVPSRIVIMEHLPAAATGKILKKELQRMASAGY